MTFRRLMAAAALFLAATCVKIYMPEQAERALPTIREMIDGDDFALPLPDEALRWLELS